jgi:CO dehydrogenase nickel-insertion accessory protein CooC1
MPRDSVRHPLDGAKIGIFGKGGAGKSTLAVLLARGLLRAEYGTAILDADSTNSGMAKALGIATGPRSLIEHYGGMVFSGGRVTCPVDDPTPLPDSEIWLDDPPENVVAGPPGGIRLLTAGKMGGLGVGSGCDGPIAKIVRDLRVHEADRDPVLVVDLKAGYEDSARGVVIGLDQLVVVVDPTVAAVRMAADMKASLEALHHGAGPATGHLADPDLVALARGLYRHARVGGMVTVLNKVAGTETESRLRVKLAAHGIVPVATLPVVPEIADAWLEEEPVEGAAASGAIDLLVTALERGMEIPRPVTRPGSRE